MKNNSTVFLIIIIAAYFSLCSCQAGKNAKNIKMIEQGMSKTQVDSIMGDKFTAIDDYFDSTKFQQVYSNTIISADHYRIYFSKKDSTVVDVGYGE